MGAGIDESNAILAFMCFPGPNETPIFRYFSIS